MALANTTPELRAPSREQRDGIRGAAEEITAATDLAPPDDVPETIDADLERSGDARLGAIVHYAHRPLRAQPPLIDELEALDGEEIGSIEDHGAYATVVESADVAGSDGARYAYRVQSEPGIEDEDGQYRWHCLGRIGTAGGT